MRHQPMPISRLVLGAAVATLMSTVAMVGLGPDAVGAGPASDDSDVTAGPAEVTPMSRVSTDPSDLGDSEDSDDPVSTDDPVVADLVVGSSPTVTVERAADQSRSTNDATIRFAVEFSEAVTGFDPADVVVDGTATGGTVVVGGTGTSYTVSISGTTQGTVIVSVPSAAATTGSGASSAASTSAADGNVVEYDVFAPYLTVPSDVSRNNDPGRDGAVVTFKATATDPPAGEEDELQTISGPAQTSDADVDVECNRASGTFLSLGTTTVTCSATDRAGNTETASFAISVVDVEDPVFAASPDVTEVAVGSVTPVDFASPVARDNSKSATVVCDPPARSDFAIGTSPVTCTASDPSGNTATIRFDVVVSAALLPATGRNADLAGIAWKALLVGLLLVGLSRIPRQPRPRVR